MSELDTERSISLDTCAQEPIHLPGSIQPHGFLLVLNETAMRVTMASESAAAYLGKPLHLLFGATLTELLGADAGLESLLEKEVTTSSRYFKTLQVPAAGGRSFEVIGHRQGSFLIMEFEESVGHLDTEAVQIEIYNFMTELRQMRSLGEICSGAVTLLRKLTGFDRVLLYSFDDAGHGNVLAEDRNAELPSYLHLRFPASDIPEQARRLYVVNRVRVIPDVDYVPSRILDEEGRTPEFDLSGSVLRSVSPIHRDYMRNMGTAASMSVSIVSSGRLWGLVSFHNRAPRRVPYRLRTACDFLVQVVTSHIEALLESEKLSRAIELTSIQHRLLTWMAAEDNYLLALTSHGSDLMALTGAHGAAIVLDQSCTLVGNTPSADQVLDFTAWLQQSARGDVFATSSAVSIYPPASHFAACASGIVAVSISKLHDSYVLWFRPEVVQSVRWAGDPQKPVAQGKGDLTIHPRNSFESWMQILRGHSLPWLPEEINAASAFRAAILEVVLRRAEEMARLAGDLEVANRELEAFSYSVSHDLRAPFRHIAGFAELLREEESGHLTSRGQHYVDTIVESARFAGLLVDSLLNFSRIARVQISPTAVDMTQLFKDEWGDVVREDGHQRQIEFTAESLPKVMGDPQLLRQVARNLLSNALKYTRYQPHATVSVSATREGREYIFSVEDNGVGFDQRYADKLFGVFQRLHRMEDFEGTGIGLANVRRIITRHGGRTWAQGETGKGAIFYFSLPVIA